MQHDGGNHFGLATMVHSGGVLSSKNGPLAHKGTSSAEGGSATLLLLLAADLGSGCGVRKRTAARIDAIVQKLLRVMVPFSLIISLLSVLSLPSLLSHVYVYLILSSPVLSVLPFPSLLLYYITCSVMLFHFILFVPLIFCSFGFLFFL